MNDEFEMVREFHKKLGRGTPSFPVGMTTDKRITWTELIIEEVFEFTKADDIAGQVDATLDLIYLCLGIMVKIGVKPDGLFQLIHDTNMRKLWNGRVQPVEGKIPKPDNWVGPEQDIRDELVKRITTYIEDGEGSSDQRELPFA